MGLNLSHWEVKGNCVIHPTDLHTLTLHYFGFKLCCLFLLVSLSCNPFVLAQTYLSHFPRTEHVIWIFKTWSFHAISSDLPALKKLEIKLARAYGHPRWLVIVMCVCWPIKSLDIAFYFWIKWRTEFNTCLWNASVCLCR